LKLDDEEVGLVQQKIIEIRRAWHTRNEEEVMKRWTFEKAVGLRDITVVTYLLQGAHMLTYRNRNKKNCLKVFRIAEFHECNSILLTLVVS